MKRRSAKRKGVSQSEPVALTDDDKKILANTKILMQSLQEKSLPVSEKETLLLRVEETIQQKHERSFSRAWLAMAASLALLLIAGSGYLFMRKNAGMAMEEVASKISADKEETRLELADKRVIKLSRQNSNLIYEKNGSRIQINASSVVEQQVAGAEQGFNTLTVPYGKRSTITLVDGTKIWLNSGSRLVYPARFDEDTREVYLEGQAYFSVSHAAENPFYVHTKNMKVQVLGTEFDVSAYDDDQFTAAVLVKGSIALTANQKSLLGAKERKLTPSKMAVYNPEKDSLKITDVDIESYISWKDGFLILKNAPLADILKKLSRYYRAEILVGSADAKHITFSGRLDLQDDLAMVLDAIAVSTSLTYQQTERRFTFR
ncbi:FecR domain-containing protein [Dyadobacter chenwenxiniae]|uniref:FecR domain-containing protein n=1 Tax=Dyadobacter chenwenxiniae TaxID=2906456 RepID=A0A9X1PPH9_9BACT|nr:FecR domain-containing protein [Dyadobacter chenwenxiniae]MCF0065010.1 FecR domain-containing protein [Dyadobacter chenwenxiniae]UON83128.1 FecR domain-containing protein [Dyadobacter chenwenxiniae]